MEKSNFDDLLERYAVNETTPEENAKIEAWLEVVKTEGAEEDELGRLGEEKLFQKITGNLGLKEFKETLPKPRRSMPILVGIAASVILLVSIGAVIWMRSMQPDVEKLILNDGTIVWLKGEGSRLSYYERPNDPIRYAELVGEGLFEVAKIADRPFLIQCGAANVTVLGTSFNLKVSNDSVFLDVLTGTVKVSSERDSTGVFVSPNERVVYSRLNKVDEEALSKVDIAKITKSTEYNMQFNKVGIREVLSRMEEKYDVVIKRDDSFVECPITGDFTDHSLENTLKMLSEIIDMHYVVDKRIVTITGKGCN